MRKDLKTGILFGLAVAISAIVIISVWPGVSVESRLRQSRAVGFDEPAGETGTIDEAQIGSAEAGPEPVTERPVAEHPVAELRVAAKELDGGDDAEVEGNRIRELESPRVEEKREEVIHVVSGGQTLSSISLLYYGSGSQWRRIVEANPRVITDENRLQPGMRLVIPR